MRPAFTLLTALLSTGIAMPAVVIAGQAPATAATRDSAPNWRWSVNNLTRVESWHFFEPRPGGGDPESIFVGNRLRVATTRSWRRVDFTAAVQYVQFGGLPTNAVGPGALGTGALYFEHSQSTTSHQLYPRTLALRFKLGGEITVDAGRFGYTSGAESPSGDPKIEAVKRSRLDSRLIGDFEWSMYQRAFDGVRADVNRASWHLTAAWLFPTQGGFEDAAGQSLGRVSVAAATLTLRPRTLVPRSDVALFVYRYDDERAVTGRPDNTGRVATAADVGVTTFGGSAVGSAALGDGEADWLGWFVGQTGDWYGQTHRAWSFSAEAGYQWKSAPSQPWLRAGHLTASGDDDPNDDRHETFFLMVPTVRRYASTTVYAPMNLHDTFAELALRPIARLAVRIDVRRVRLAEAADRWYSGSGATVKRGTFFGFAGRPSGGAADLGHVVEGSADLRLGAHWSINGFAGGINGGDVVRTFFAGHWLRYVYVESVIQY
jgi:hypothetical protein